MKVFSAFVFSSVVLCSFALVSKSHVKFENNAYNNVLVAIHASVREDLTLIDKIKQTFTDASKFLYKATRRRAYFGRVFIIAPSTWSVTYRTVSAATITDSDFVVSASHSSRRNFPFTRSYGGCGRPGIHIQMDTDFLLKPSAPLINRHSDKFLVHEWASYRYGVFQEYPSPGENQFYFSTIDGKISPVRCSRGLRGYIMKVYSNGTRQVCNPGRDADPNTGELPDGCIYYPYPAHNLGTMSIMDHQYIQEILNFCDDTTDDDHSHTYGHNREPPNRHNRLCSHRSTWDIITHTPDFASNNNAPVTKSDAELVPAFMMFKDHAYKRVAVVMDMPKQSTDQLHREVRQAVRHLIRDGLSKDTDIAVIHTGMPNPHKPSFRHIRSVNAKDLLSPFPDDTHDINIEHIVEHTIQTLNQNESDETAKHLVIFNCGKGNQSAIYDAIGTTSNVIHHVITCKSIGIDKEKDRGSLTASHTEAHFHEATTGTDGNTLLHTVHTLSHHINREEDRDVQLVNEATILQPHGDFSGTFSLDDSLHGDPVITVHYSSMSPKVVLISPQGVKYDAVSADNVERDDDLKILRIRIQDQDQSVKFGDWNYTIYNDGDSFNKISIVVLTSPHDNFDVYPVTMKGWVKVFEDTTPNRIGVYAEVVQGHHPIAGLTVKAYISTGTGRTQELQLMDNGAGADMTKHDGIYSRYLTKVTQSGYHDFIIKVTDPERNGEIQITKRVSVKIHKSESGFEYHTSKKKLQHRITRSASARSVYLLKEEKRPGSHPPSQIVDLHIDRLFSSNRTVLLSWTAPGNDLDIGKASEYDLRHSESGLLLLDSIEGAGVFRNDDIVMGNMSAPSEAGQREYFMIKVPGTSKSVAIRIRARDREGNCGEFSNLATGGFHGIFTEKNGAIPIQENRVQECSTTAILCVMFMALVVIYIIRTIRRSSKQNIVERKEMPIP